MESVWKRDSIPRDGKKGDRIEREPLPGDRKVNTLVIGAGMTGILTAYFLQKSGVEVIVVEAKNIAGGQTQNTTAKITSQHGLFYNTCIQKVGRTLAMEYARANERAISLYEQIIEEENVECNFKRLPSYLYSTEEDNVAVLQREAEAAASLGIPAAFLEGKEITELPFAVRGAVRFENQAQFHPLKFIEKLAGELTIYENTKVLSVNGHVVYTSRGDIRAEHIVFATHYPFVNVPGFYFLREHQERSYVLALKDQKELSGMYYCVDKKGLSLRSEGDVLLLGGGGHRTGKCYRKLQQKENENGEIPALGYGFLRKMAQRYYPDAVEICAWSAQDCMPHDDIPFIGKYSVWRPYWYVATGFKKWGMTSAMVSAVIISHQISQKVSAQERAIVETKIFSPQRCLVRAAFKNGLVDMGESVLGLTKGLFSGKERRCPHMGCKLEENGEEGCWECPCHGSRFSKDGKLLDNPAQVDLGEKE